MAVALAAHLRQAAGLALAAMWVFEVLVLLFSWHAARWAGMAVFAAYFAVALVLSRPAQRWVIAAIAALAVAGALHYSIPAALARGIESAVLFAAFLAAMQMLGVALESSPAAGVARSQFTSLDRGQRHDSILLRTHLLSSVLGAGGLAAVSPLLDRARPAQERRAFAESALQGFGLVVLWSPFFVAMAVSTRLARDATLAAAVASGLAMASVGLALSHLLHGGRLGLAVLAPLRRTLGEAALLAAAIIVANRLWGLGNLEAVALGIPLASLWIARHKLRTGLPLLGRRWYGSLQSIAVEALVVGVSMALGEVIRQLLAQGMISIPHGMGAWPTGLLIALPLLVMLPTALVGLHPIVSASCLVPLLASVDKLHSLAVTGSVLLGWMPCVMLSNFVVPVMYAASLFDVRQAELVRGRNLRFCAIFTPIGLLYLWGLNSLLGPGT